MIEKSFYVEHRIGPGEEDFDEFEYKIEVDDWSPYDPGVCSGPVESCYPPEGGEVSFSEDTIQRRLNREEETKWEEVPFSIFMEGYAERFDDDPPDKKYPRTARRKAEESLEEEMYEACEEHAQGAYEDAMERKGEEMRERMMEGDDW